MTSPDADEPHAIADTQMFRRFVDDGPDGPAATETKKFWMWTWPGLLVPVVVSIAVVVVVILLTR